MRNLKSLTIVGASKNSEKPSHQVLRKALEERMEVYAVNPTTNSIHVTFSDGTEKIVPTYPTLSKVPRRTDFVALYIPREKILAEVATQVVEIKFPNLIIPPPQDFSQRDENLERQIIAFFKDHGYRNENILVNACYLRGIPE